MRIRRVRPAIRGAGRVFRKREAGGETEGAALARCAADRDLATHQLDQLAADGETQPGAAETPGNAAVGLGEWGEEVLLLLGRNANAGIADGEGEADGIVFAVQRGDADVDLKHEELIFSRMKYL